MIKKFVHPPKGSVPEGVPSHRGVLFVLIIGVGLAGCGQEGKEKHPPDTKSSGSVGADHRDDTRFPNLTRFLPSTGQLRAVSWARRWYKKEPIRVTEAGELAQVLGGQAEAYLSFNFQRLASVVYQTDAGNVRGLISVDLAEFSDSEDAFGLAGVLKSFSDFNSLDQGGHLWLGKTSDGEMVDAVLWKGRYVVRFSGDIRAKPEMNRLARSLSESLEPDSAKPLLLSLLPSGGQAKPPGWFLRKIEGLTGPTTKAIPCGDIAPLQAVLQLDGSTRMVVAAYHVGGSDNLNYVWVVQYPTPVKALAAHKRYQIYLESDAGRTDSVAQVTTVDVPQGAYLVGSWTAEEESMEPKIPAIKVKL